jgi:hypothetical protein
MLDEAAKKFDYEAGHHRARARWGRIAKYRKEAVDAKPGTTSSVGDRQVRLAQWTPVAVAPGLGLRLARTGLYNTRPPELKMFSAKQNKSEEGRERQP